MARRIPTRVSRDGTYVVKAAETRPTRVAARRNGRDTKVTEQDQQLASELLRAKRS